MNIKDILNADLPTLAQWLRRGFAWWIDELAQILPESWRKRLFANQPDILLEVGERGMSFRNKDGHQVEPATLSRRERDSVRVVVPLSSVLTRVVDFPILPMSDVRRMVSLDIDRLTPFKPDAVCFDAELIRRDAERGRQQVFLGVLPRNSATELMSNLEKIGITPVAFGAAGGSGVHFDFLPAMRGATGGLSARSRLPYWWLAVAVLMILNLMLISYRDSAQLDALQQIVDSQAGPVAVAMRLHSAVEAEAARRRALIERQKKYSPLRVLDAVTKALPANAWTQTFEWNGQTVHLVGFSNGPADLLRSLESSPSLHNARTMSHDTAPLRQTGMQPFDVAADAGKGNAR